MLRELLQSGDLPESWIPPTGVLEWRERVRLYKSLVDQFVLLGFGTTGKDLQKAYNLKFVKDETVAEQKCSRIELDPKDSKVKKQYSKFELCIADPGGYPVLQKLIEPSGNYTSITYSDIKLNPDLRPEAMNLNLPAGVKREYPQK